jgi:hydroxymethylglutaryl-CoA synthase
LESSSWDGRYALVVAGDIAVYAAGNARPTGGCGAVAILLGPNAPLVFDRGVRATHMEHVYDFYKPDMSSEYPEVDGKLTIECYFRALDRCYVKYLEKMGRVQQTQSHDNLDVFDYLCFHSPYSKLVQKSVGRLLFLDFLRGHASGLMSPKLEALCGLRPEETYFDRNVEKTFLELSGPVFHQKTFPSLFLSKNLGNMYAATLFGCLASLLTRVPVDQLMGKRIGLFSFGSGSSASMFSLQVLGDISHITQRLNLVSRLTARRPVSAVRYDQIMALRESTHNAVDYKPQGDIKNLSPGTYYLDHIDSKRRRYHAYHP